MVCVAKGPEEVGQWPPGFREDSDWLAFLSLSSSTNVHGPTHGQLGLLLNMDTVCKGCCHGSFGELMLVPVHERYGGVLRV
eukprot:2240027-Prymnesium_polylepis.1